ncbi:hypothetical protein EIP86_005442 [Pleurotus ostreatoroseus]|nr:hypothetical protein EIP86_005442 [Pleurotus ostreatoroseus]
MDELEKLRPAGLLERYHITRCLLGIDSCVIASARYTSRSGVSLDKTRLQNAMRRLIVRQPALGTQVVGSSSGKPQLVRLRYIDVEQAIEGPFTSPLEEVFIHYLTRPFNVEVNRPLWRLGFCKDGTVVFVFHHAIGDGQSSISFHMALLDSLNTPTPLTIVELPPPLLPAVESLTDTAVSIIKLLHEVYGLFAPDSWQEGSQAWTGNAVVTVPTLQTNISFWELNAPDAERLLSLCRRRNCTLTAFLYVMALEALSYTIAVRSPDILKQYKNLSTNVAVSLRRFTETPLTEICDQASKFHCFAPIACSVVEQGIFLPDSFPWDRAIEFCARLHAGLGSVRQDIGAMAYLFGHFEEYFTGMLGKKRESTFTISNIGKFPDDRKDGVADREWKVGSMYFGQCDATAGAAIKLNIVGAPDGSLGITFTWGKGALDDDIAHSFLETVKTWTAELIAHDIRGRH